MDIFVNGDLKVNRVVTPNSSLPASIRIRGTDSGSKFFDEQKFAVITGIEYAQSSNYQLSQSLDDTIYLYTFGDKPGMLTVKGIAFAGVCDGGVVGLDGILEFYAKTKISSRINNEIPQVQIIMSQTTLFGYLTDCTIAMLDPATRISSFVLSLKVTG